MKKITAVLLVLVLCVCCLCVTAFAENEEMVPVLVSVPEDWGTPNLWAWADDGTNAFAAWPGLALNKKGISIPGDMGVLTFDDYPFSRMIEPPLTVVDINVRHMGAQAGKFLLDIIRHPNTQVQTFVTSSDVIRRASTR